MAYGPPPGYPPPGYGPPPPGYPPPGYGYPPPKKGMSAIAIIAIIIGVMFGGCVLLVAVGAGGAKEAAKKQEEKDKSARADAKSVTADVLSQAYTENEVAADEKYKGEWLKVSGTVERIDSGIGDAPIVHLRGKEMFQSVMVNDLSKSDAASLKKGQALTVVCRCDGEIIGSPRLEECTIE